MTATLLQDRHGVGLEADKGTLSKLECRPFRFEYTCLTALGRVRLRRRTEALNFPPAIRNAR